MLVLPIKLVTREDKDLVGDEIYNLAKLARNSFPVVDGLVVFPPNFKKILERLNINNQESFNTNKEVVRKLIQKIELIDSLKNDLKASLNQDQIKRIWHLLLDSWFEELSKNINKITSQTIFFTDKILASGTVFLKKKLELKEYVEKSMLSRFFLLESEISVTEGEVDVAQKKVLENLAIRMDSLLGISQNYHFIIDENKKEGQQIKIVKLSPPMVVLEDDLKSKSSPFINVLKQKELNISSVNKITPVKVYVDYSQGVSINENVDGIILESSQFSEDKENNLAKIAKEMLGKNIIFKLDDFDKNSQIISNSRNKQKLFNIQVAIKNCKSITDFINDKRELASLGVVRKGSLKFWLELSTPENFLNVEEYVNQGLDGVLINLDQLLEILNGEYENMQFNIPQISTLLKFIEDGLRTLNKLRIPILATGKVATNDDVLRFLLSKGVYGIVINPQNVNSFYDDLIWIQKYTHKNLLA